MNIPSKPYTSYQFEIVRHSLHEPGPTVHRPADIATYVDFIAAFHREHCLRMDLNCAHEILGYETVSIGTDNQTLIGPKEIFRGALLTGASTFILIHNHPSGRIEPSREDCDVASRIKVLGEQLELPLLDFMIMGRNGQYYSFIENDMLL